MLNRKLIATGILCLFLFSSPVVFGEDYGRESADNMKYMFFTHGTTNDPDFSYITVNVCDSIKITVCEDLSNNNKILSTDVISTDENGNGPDLSIEFSLVWLSPKPESKANWHDVVRGVWRIYNIGDPYFFEEGDVGIYLYYIYPDKEVEDPLSLHLEEGSYIPTGELVTIAPGNAGIETPIALRLEIHSTLPEPNFDNNIKTDYLTMKGVTIEGYLYKIRPDGKKTPIAGKAIYSNSDIPEYNELDFFLRSWGTCEDGWYILTPPKNPVTDDFSYTVIYHHSSSKEISKKTPPLNEFSYFYMDISVGWSYPFLLPFWRVGERKEFQYSVVNNDSVPWEDVVVKVGTPYDFWFDGKLWLASLNQYDSNPEPVWQRDHPDRFDMVGHNRTTIVWRFDRLEPGECRVLNFSIRLTYYRPVDPYPSGIVTLPPEFYENCSDNVHPAVPIYPIAEVIVDVEGVKLNGDSGVALGGSASSSGDVNGELFSFNHSFKFWPVNPVFDITVDKWMKFESHGFYGQSYGPLEVRKRVSTFNMINETVRFYVGFYPTVDSDSVVIQDYSIRDYLPPFLEYKSSTVQPSNIIKNNSGTYLVWNFSDISYNQQCNKNGWFYYNATVKSSGVIDKCFAVVNVHRMWISGIGGIADADVPVISNSDWVSISALHPVFTLIDFSSNVLVVDPSVRDENGCVSVSVMVSRVLPDTHLGESVYYGFEDGYDWLDIIPCEGELSCMGDSEEVLFVVNVSRIPDFVGSGIGSSDEDIASYVFSNVTVYASVGFPSGTENYGSVEDVIPGDEHPADDVPDHAPIEFVLSNALSIVFESVSDDSSASGTIK